MEKYFLEQFLAFWKELRLFRASSVVLLLATAPFVFKLTTKIKEFADWLLARIPVISNIIPENRDYIPVLTVAESRLIVWFLLFLTVRRVMNWLYNFLLEIELNRQGKVEYLFATDNEENLKNLHKKLSSEWLIQGNPHLNKDGFVITNTNSGCLIKPSIIFDNSFLNVWSGLKIWKNLKATIHVQYKNQKETGFNLCLAVVFRAQSHDDYFMVELWKSERLVTIRPHVRVSGNWDAPVLNADSNSYALEKDTDDFTYVLELENDILTITINGDKNKQLIWTLPTHYEINLVQHGETKNANNKGVSESAIHKIPFKDKAGMFGFRNYGNEIAIVEKLEIEPLNKYSDSN